MAISFPCDDEVRLFSCCSVLWPGTAYSATPSDHIHFSTPQFFLFDILLLNCYID